MSIRVMKVIHLCIKTTKFVISQKSQPHKSVSLLPNAFLVLVAQDNSQVLKHQQFLANFLEFPSFFGIESTLFEFYELLLTALLCNV